MTARREPGPLTPRPGDCQCPLATLSAEQLSALGYPSGAIEFLGKCPNPVTGDDGLCDGCRRLCAVIAGELPD